jgi:hypothetical protein
MHVAVRCDGNDVARERLRRNREAGKTPLPAFITRRRSAGRFGVAQVHLRKNCANFSGTRDPHHGDSRMPRRGDSHVAEQPGASHGAIEDTDPNAPLRAYASYAREAVFAVLLASHGGEQNPSMTWRLYFDAAKTTMPARLPGRHRSVLIAVTATRPSPTQWPSSSSSSA